MAGLLPIALVAGLVSAVYCRTLPENYGCVEADEYWKPGSTYTYDYETHAASYSDSGTNAGTAAKITCKVDLSTNGDCIYVIKTHDCELSEVPSPGLNIDYKKHEKSDAFNAEMRKNTLQFVMTKGQVRDVLPYLDEPVSILNIKRGIITNLQGCRRHGEHIEDDTVMDVQGICPVHFEKSGNTIKQVKDVKKCLFPTRHDWNLSPSSLFWNASFMQAGIHAESHCTHELSSEALKESVCEERHAVHYDERTHKAHAQTVVAQKMELKDTKSGSIATDRRRQRHTGIQYEYEAKEQPKEQPENFEEKAYKIVQDVVDDAHDGVQPDTESKLSELVSLLRRSPDVSALTQKIIAKSFNSGIKNEIALSFYRDALVTCNRESCIKAVSYLAVNGHLSDNYLIVLLYKLTKVRVNKPGYLDAVYDICKAKPSRTCLLSLTSMIHTYVQHNAEQVKADSPKAIKQTVDHLVQMLTNPSGKAPQDRAEKIILGLKAFGNLGDIAVEASPQILTHIQALINDKDKPQNVSIEAIKSLRRVGSHNTEVYNMLIKIVKDVHNSVEHRALAYMVLTFHYHENLYRELAEVLGEIKDSYHGTYDKTLPENKDESDQLRNFVTMHMNNIMLYGDESIQQLKNSVRRALSHYPRVFVVRGDRPLTTSRVRAGAASYKSPLLPDLANQFGFGVQGANIFETFSYIPVHSFLNVTSQLFGKKYNTLTLGAALHGLDPYLEYFLRFKTGGDPKALFEKFRALQENNMDVSKLLRKSDWVPHYDSAVEQKITEIHNSVVHDYGKLPFAASFNIKRYGDELAYTSYGIIKAKIYNFVENELQAIQWHESKQYTAHRFVRFIEAVHQVPTIAGLPLKWKLTADLVFSLRVQAMGDPFGLILDPPFFNGQFSLHPSGSVTMVNKMYVKVPHYTKNGVQATTTIYRSRDNAGSLTYLDGELEVKVELSPRRQHLFNFYRDTKFIRGYEKEDIPDGKLERIEKEDCYSCEYTGLKFCRYKSYADYKNRRPIDVLTNKMEYRLWYELADKGLKEYQLNVKRTSEAEAEDRQFTFEFKAPGEKWKREVKGRFSVNKKTKEFSVQATVPEKPHFKLQASRKLKPTKDGYITDVDAEIFQGRPIVIHGESTIVSPDNKDVKVSLKLKDRSYKWNRRYVKTGDRVEVDHDLIYESNNPHSLMHQVLPSTVWENDKTAKIHFHVDVNKESSEDIFARSINAHVKCPKGILELNTDRISGDENRRALHLNLTKRELPSNDVQAFIHLTYDMWNHEKDDTTDRTHRIRLALPKLRWTAELDRKYNKVDNKNVAFLKREKSTDGTLEVTDSTPVDDWEIRFTLDHHNASQLRGDQYPTPRERHVHAVLKYPRDGTYHTVTYKTQIINDDGQRNAQLSFKTDSTLESSYWQIKAHGKSNFILDKDKPRFVLDYKADIDNLKTSKKANYDFHLAADLRLPLVEMTENYQSSRFTKKQTLNVKRTDDGATRIDLEIHTDCPEWDFLTLDLKQVFHLDRDNSWEKMEFKHKYIDIDVKSEFKMPFCKHLKKEFNIKSKNSIIPNMKVSALHEDCLRYFWHVEYPDEKRNVYAVANMGKDYKDLDVEVSHDKDGSPKHKVLTWGVHLVKPDVISTNYTVDKKAIKAAVAIYAERFKKLVAFWNSIKDDPNHQMNKYLSPLLKTPTVGEYLRQCKKRMEERRAAIRAAVLEVAKSLEPIYGSVVEFIKNVAALLEKHVLSALRENIEQSYIVQYLQRPEVKEKIKKYFRDAAERGAERLASLSTTTSGDGTKNIWHPLHWKRFDSIPQITPRLVRSLHAIRSSYDFNPFPGNRYAVLYGEGNIRTFDGAAYRVSNIPNKNCKYLLAHDFVSRYFTLLVQENHFHLLLPEIAVTVDIKGNVMFNNANTPVKLPYDDNGLEIEKEDHIIHVHTKYGIDLELDAKHRVGVVISSFWNHNKTLGLLGNNDNEDKNDFRKLDGSNANDVAHLLAEYEVSGNAECSDINALGKPEEFPKPYQGECYQFFNDRNVFAPLYMCSDVVNMDSFLEACLKDTRAGVGQCSSVHAYIDLCGKQQIPLSVPTGCE